MKRKLLAAVLSLCMVVGLLPATAMAEGEAAPEETSYVAQIGEQRYATLQAAVDAGGEITLLDNVTESITIPADKTITINLSGHTLTGSDLSSAILNNGTLNLIGNGTITNRKNYAVDNHGTMTIDGPAVTDGVAGAASLIRNGWDSQADAGGKTAELTIKSGTFTGGMNVVKNDACGDLHIEDGTFTHSYKNSKTAAVMTYSKATITGGTFSSAKGVAVMVLEGDDTGSIGDLSVSNGIFKSGNSNYECIDYDKQSGVTVTVSGGRYSTSLVVADSNDISDNYYRMLMTDGMYEVTNQVDGHPHSNTGIYYETKEIAERKNRAQMDGTYYYNVNTAIKTVSGDETKTITLVQDHTNTVITVNEGQNIVIDLNEHSVSCGSKNTIKNSGNLTIKNGTIENTQKKTAILNEGTLTLDSMTVTSKKTAINSKSGTINEINDGHYTGSITANSEKKFISGGTFTQSVSQYVNSNLHFELNDDGIYTYYATEKEAMNAATSDSATVKDTDDPDAVPAQIVTVAYEGADIADAKMLEGSEIILTAPDKGQYFVFLYWTVKDDTTSKQYMAGDKYIINADTTFVAHWQDNTPVPVTGVTLDKSTLSLDLGNVVSLIAAITPDNATDKTAAWTSSNENIVTVKDGVITAVGYGTAVVTVKVGAVEASCTVTVSYPYIPVVPTQPTQPSQPDTPDEPDTPVAPAVNYADVAANDWYYDEVAYVTAKGLMTGTTPTMFAPNATTTRAMVWTILGRMSGQKVDGGDPWYSLAQSWAVTSGVSDGTNPNGSITREELAVMLYRYAGSPAVGLPELAKLGQFTDGEAVSDWAQEAMAWAVSNGIISGNDGAILPQQSAARAEVAAMLMRFCELNNK